MNKSSIAIFSAIGYRNKDVRLVRAYVKDNPDKESVKILLSSFDIDREDRPLILMLDSLLQRFPDIKHKNAARIDEIIESSSSENKSAIAGFRLIAGALSNANIPVMLIKDIALEYIKPGRRAMNSADICVPFDMWHKALEVAKEAGFSTVSMPLHAAKLEFRDGTKVNIHKTLFECGWLAPKQLAWMGTADIDAFGEKAFLSRPEILALSLLINFYAGMIYDDSFWRTDETSRQSRHMQWILDFANIIKSTEAFDYQIFIRGAEMLGFVYRARVLLDIFDYFLPNVLPKGILNEMRRRERGTNQDIARDLRMIKLFKAMDKARTSKRRIPFLRSLGFMLWKKKGTS